VQQVRGVRVREEPLCGLGGAHVPVDRLVRGPGRVQMRGDLPGDGIQPAGVHLPQHPGQRAVVPAAPHR
jgi:hypothetical protein